MKKINLTTMAILFTALFCLCGCTLITLQNPFADIDKLGTVIKPGESITIQSTNGMVTVEYLAPTKRRIVWKGESRDISLLKSSALNGIYCNPTKFREGAMGDIHGVSYGEATITFSSDKEYEDYLRVNVEGLGFEHRMNEQLVVHCSINKTGKKYFYIGIDKYRFTDEIAENKPDK